MAGALLLIKKEGYRDFNNICAGLRKSTRAKFAHLFKDLRFDNPDKNSFLIQFKKDNSEKFYKDKNGNWLVFEGNVFSLKETKIHDAKTLLRLYLAQPDSFPNLLDGHFVIKIFDARNDKYVVFNDFIKSKTNYLAENDSLIMFTPFLALAAHIRKVKVDPFALNEYLWRYYIMSEKSMVKNVSRLSTASVYTIKSGRVRQESFWEFPHSYTQQSFKQGAEQLTESLKESARLINNDGRNPLIEFTMGQDSRTVLAAFTNQGFDFSTAIFGKDSYHEVIGVNKINQKLGFNSVHVSLEDSFVENPWQALKDSILLGSAEEPAYIMGRILYMREQYPQFSTLVLNGVHGRFYKDGIWNEMYVMNFYREPKNFNLPVFIKYRALNKDYKRYIFNKDYQKLKNESPEYFKALIENSIKNHKESPVAIQVDKFDVEHYAVFGTVANDICNCKIDLLSPLLFRRNLEPAFSMPAQWKYNLSKLQRQVVFNLDQRLAREKTDFGGINMMPKNAFTMPPFLFKYWYSQSKKFRDKIKNIMGFNVKTQLQKAWDYKTIYQNFYFSDEVQSFLNYDSMVLSEILDKKEWQKLKVKYEQTEYQTLDNLEFILKLFTVEYFLKIMQDID